MLQITKHAKERLRERFGVDDCTIKEIISLFGGGYKLTSIDIKGGEEHREITYNGSSIHGVIDNGRIITCYAKDCFPDPMADAVTMMHTQLDKFRIENNELKEKVKKYRGKEDLMEEIIASKGKFMAITDVANVLNVNEITVRRAVNELFPGLIQNGKLTKLTEPHVTAIKLRIEKNHPDKNVEVAHTELEETLLIRQGYELLLKRETALAEENALLKRDNEVMKPKAALADMAIRDNYTHYSITEAGKHLGLRQSEMFNLLRSKRMLTVENLPTQAAIDAKILQERTNVCQDGKNRKQAIMTMENVFNFKERFLK